MDLLLRRRRMMAAGGSGRNLPAGYTAYDWIKCNVWKDGSYIDTGIQDQDSGVAYKTKVRITVSDPSYAFIIGTTGWRHNLWFNSRLSVAYVNKVDQYIYWQGVNQNGIYEIECDDDALFVNGNLGTTYSDSGNNVSGHIQILSGQGGRNIDFPVYYAKIYIDGVLVRDMIPCTNASDAPGMYDFVSRSFFPNAGTGTLVVGND